MPLAQELKQRPAFRLHDKRRFQRMNLNLLGRFMLEDRREYPCQTKDISPGSAALVTPITARMDERAVAYIDHIGRIEGRILRTFDGGFAMSITATARRRDKLAAKLTWLANRHELDLPEDRRHDRVSSPVDAVAISLPDGREYRAGLADVSLSGAALALEVQPPLGSPLMVGKLRSHVVRHIEGGIAVEFSNLQTRDSLKDGLD